MVWDVVQLISPLMSSLSAGDVVVVDLQLARLNHASGPASSSWWVASNPDESSTLGWTKRIYLCLATNTRKLTSTCLIMHETTRSSTLAIIEDFRLFAETVVIGRIETQSAGISLPPFRDFDCFL